jgi:hypothetical protein
MRKAEGLSINVVIAFIITSIVLIIIILILTGRFRIFNNAAESCDSRPNAQCKQECDIGNEVSVPGVECSDDLICCMKLTGS